jgi:hypothetical protein
MECEGCKHYEMKKGGHYCIWFETKISKTFPGWDEDFRRGKLKFRGCGFYNAE